MLIPNSDIAWKVSKYGPEKTPYLHCLSFPKWKPVGNGKAVLSFKIFVKRLYTHTETHCKITQGLCDPFCVASWYSKMFLHILHEHIIMKHENICREFYHGGCFHSLIIKSYSGLVSYCQNSDIRELNVLLVQNNDKIHETFPEINSLAILWISNLKIFSLYI